MTDPPDAIPRFDPAANPDRWFRLFPNEHLVLVRMDVPPTRDEHVNTMASRLTEVAGTAHGNLALDLSVVEFYSWTWIRALIDLSARCSDLGGELRLRGINAEGQKLLNANKSMMQSGRNRPRRDAPQPSAFLPIGGRANVVGFDAERTGRRLIRNAA